MSQPVGYAADWLEIATEIKQAAGYRFGGFMQSAIRLTEISPIQGFEG